MSSSSESEVNYLLRVFYTMRELTESEHNKMLIFAVTIQDEFLKKMLRDYFTIISNFTKQQRDEIRQKINNNQLISLAHLK